MGRLLLLPIVIVVVTVYPPQGGLSHVSACISSSGTDASRAHRVVIVPSPPGMRVVRLDGCKQEDSMYQSGPLIDSPPFMR